MSPVRLGESDFITCVLYGTCILTSTREITEMVKEGDRFVACRYKPNLEMRTEVPGVPYIIMTLFLI